MERNKFEEMLERLVNEDTQGAKDLFHEIVVEKSRNIYESLLENDMYADEEVDEAADMDDEDELDEDFDLEEDFDIEEDFDLEEGDDDMEGPEMDMDMDMGDEGDMDMDMDMDDMDDDMGDEVDGELEDRVDNIEGMLDSLKAEMDELFAEKEGEDGDTDMEDGMDGDMDMEDDMGGDETDDLEADVEADDEDEEEDDEPKNESEMMASYLKKLDEYTQKTGGDTYDKFAPGGDNGTGSSLHGGKNPSIKDGGSTTNIAKSAVEPTSSKAKGFTGGAVKGELKSGNVNTKSPKGASKLNKVSGGAGKKAEGEGTAKQFLKPAK
jgi:hypothetical protein